MENGFNEKGSIMNIITNDTEKLNRAEVAMKMVIDPEIGLNVVDLGLIYQLDFDPAEMTLFCSMTLTSRFCPMGEAIHSGVENALQQAFPEYKINVSLAFDPPWNPERISVAGREFLNQ